jgi:hypothetical protein
MAMQGENVSSVSSPAPTLKDLDKILASTEGAFDDNELQSRALSVVHDMQSAGALPSFGAARRIPKRAYTLSDMRLNKIDASKLLSPTEETLSKVEAQLQAAFAGLVVFAAFYDGFDLGRAGVLVFCTLFLLSADQIGFNGGLRALVTDTAGRVLAPHYRCAVRVSVAACADLSVYCWFRKCWERMPRSFQVLANKYF